MLINFIILGSAAIILLFGFVLLFGAPYLPTLSKQQEVALDLLDLQPGQVLLELGSGDGRMLVAAAKRGMTVIGYEINPILVLSSRILTWRYRRLVSVRMANFWWQKLPDCDGIYVFLLDKYMSKLHNKITQEITKPIRLVSFAFEIPEYKHVKEKSGLYLYIINNKKSKKSVN